MSEQNKVSDEALKKLPFSRHIAYALGDFGNNFSWAFIGSFLSYFWTDVLGVGAGFVGTIMLLSRFWDAVNDPIVGSWADNTNTKFGRYRPWIIFAAIPMGIINVIAFTKFGFVQSTGAKNAFALITFFVLVFVFTCVNIPYSAMASACTLNTEERSKMASFRLVGSYAGNLIVARNTLKLVEAFGKGDSGVGYSRTALLYSVIMIVCLFLCFIGSKELITPKSAEKTKITDGIKTLKGNTPVLIICAGFLVYGLFSYGRASTAMYYFTYVAGDQSLFSTYSLFNVGGCLLGSLLMPKIAHMFNNKATVPKIGFFIVTLSMIIIGGFIDPTVKSQVNILFAVQFIASTVQGMSVSSLYSMIPDCTEYTQLKSGVRAPGFISSTTSFAMKLGMGLGTAGIGWVLQACGYVAGQAQTQTALNGIRIFFTFVPGAMTLIAAIALCFYKIDKKTYAETVEKLGMANSENV